nr:hypothetical protein Iba_chr04aCG11190 [Ipomoea batatas]
MIEAQICICSWGKRETNAAIAAKNKRFRVAPPGYGSIISMPESLESRKDGEDIIRASRNAQINLTRKHSSAYKHLYLFLGQERNQRRHGCKEPEIPGRPARIRLGHLNARKPRESEKMAKTSSQPQEIGETSAAMAAKNRRFRVAPPGYGSVISMPESLENWKRWRRHHHNLKKSQINLTRKHSSAYELEKPAPPWLQRTGDSGSPHQDTARGETSAAMAAKNRRFRVAPPEYGSVISMPESLENWKRWRRHHHNLKKSQINLTRKHSSAYELEKPAPPWLQRTGDSGSPHQDTARSVFVLGAREKPAPPWLQRTGDSGSPRQDKARSSQCPKVGKDGEDIITASRNAQINLTRKHSSAYKQRNQRRHGCKEPEIPGRPARIRLGHLNARKPRDGETSAAMAAKNRRFRVAPPGYGSGRNQRRHGCKEPEIPGRPTRIRLGHLYARKPRKLEKMAKTPSQPQEIPN